MTKQQQYTTSLVALVKGSIYNYTINQFAAQVNEVTALADSWDWQIARNDYLATFEKSRAFYVEAIQVSFPRLAVNFWNF